MIAIFLILLGVLLRVLPHPANFAPVAAIAIFGGALLPRYWAVGVPVAAMAISDIFIGLHDLILVTWGCYALIALISRWGLKKMEIGRGVLVTLSGSILFFAVTNFAVWAEGRLYVRTLSGLGETYTMALPFFRNTLASDMLYTWLLFGLYWLSQHSIGIYKSTIHLKQR
jgi:hypothetical protein